MVSSFGQPEFTVTVIAMWCHMVWNPASHLTEITRENSRSLPMKWRATLQEGKHPRRKQQGLSLELATTCLRRKHLSRGRAQSIACHPSLRNRRTHWLTEVPTTYLPGHTSVSFLSTGSQLASERQSSLWSIFQWTFSKKNSWFQHPSTPACTPESGISIQLAAQAQHCGCNFHSSLISHLHTQSFRVLFALPLK